MEPTIVFGAGLAVLVFGFLAFQERLVSLLVGARDPENEELIEWQ